MNDLNKEIGLRISKLREQRQFTREQLGEISYISDRFIYDIETGQKGISAETLYKLSKAFNVTSDYLLFGVEKQNDLTYIIELLKTLDPKDIPSIEKIIFEIIAMVKGKVAR